MYHQKKAKSHIPPANTHRAAKNKHSEVGIAHTHRFSLDNNSDISAKDTSHQPPEAMNLLEPLTKFIENLQEDSSANQVPVRLDHLKEDSSANQMPVRLGHLKEAS